ncbi:MAG: 2-oxoglutarate dehydrogenase E1 component [Spirochaetaceae bacterium]|nr:MAG: 2-oxoglutarate dehydrogenase E1 component [Spirochaetaceae bacterium]
MVGGSVNANSLDLTNARFVEELYESWVADPASVDADWARYFAALDNGGVAESGLELRGIGVPIADTRPALPGRVGASADTATSGTAASNAAVEYALKQSRVNSLMWAYRDVGYIHADINPLQNYSTPLMRYMFYTMEGTYESLKLSEFSLSEADLDTEFSAGRYLKPERDTLRSILARCREIYCSTMGVEILHIQNKPMRRWLIERLESPDHRREWSGAQKQRFQKDLIKAEEFEHFLHTSYIGQKRFSLEGGEVLVPAMRYLIDSAEAHGLQEIVIGMPHRGRLNLFTNALRKPGVEVFGRFEDNYKPQTYGGSGDVKYHLGHSFDIELGDGRSIHISLAANPSHLEAVDSVVEGKARGIQRRRRDTNRKKVLPVLIHGDAAFSGQGVVAETFNLSQLKGYRTGGTVHIIVNNQIGFTTASRDARSTFFATDIAKSLPCPIFHVNGDDPEAVVRGIDLALRYRQKFGYDAVVDIQCYRRLGHNEADEPSFSHPIMYKLIKAHPSVATIYGDRLNEEGTFSRDDQNAFRERYRGVLKEELDKARAGQKPNIDDAFETGEWKRFRRGFSYAPVATSVEADRLGIVADGLTTIPEAFAIHPKLKRFVDDRRKAWDSGTGIDWSFAESLAFGSLLLDGFPVRLSGEDSGRGTFSQRHAVWWDVESDKPRTHIPLQKLADGQADFSVYDSPLSEYAVLGFDYGYSLAQPNILVLWEAQFGDFVNGAQVVIDQFIAAGESKWFRSSGLVMLLPHGYEGQGPEHSSAHLERFLQLCADENMQVCNLTTPAQYFHALRRQMLQEFRKPLILMTPKSLLRHKGCVSASSDFTDGAFRTVIDDPTPPEDADNILFCSGKVYYDLEARRREIDDSRTAIIRLEQIYPFDDETLAGILSGYPDRARVKWVQEEAKNHGAWFFVRDLIQRHVGDRPIEYVGRPPCPSPATGSHRQHSEELEQILADSFGSKDTK